MQAYFKAILVASTALVGPGAALAQSSSPFSGLFGGGDSQADSPVTLDINVTGPDEGLESQIRNTSLVSGALDEDRTTGQDVLAAARGDYARILGVLYNEGYYDGTVDILLDGIEASSVAPLDAPEVIRRVEISVNPGPVFRFSRAEMAPVVPGSKVSDEYAVDQVAGTGTIRRAALAGVDDWRNYGHAKADLGSQDIIADHDRQSVDSRIALNPGPAVTFGQMTVSGNERLNERRLRKMAGFPEGERFDPKELDTVRTRLRRSGVFSAITLQESDNLNADDSLDVDLAVIEQKTRRIGAGFEISSTDGAQVSAYWLHRNLFGGGERLRIDGEIKDVGSDTSGRDDAFTIRLDRPATITPDTTAYIELETERNREEDYDEDTASIGVGFNHIFNEQLTVNTELEYQYSRVFDDGEETDFNVLALPTEVTWDKREEPNNAKRGFYLSGEIEPFIGFDDTGSGAKVLGEGRVYKSFGTDDKFTLAGRARFGSIFGSEIEETPRNYLFFSGGGGTVRGHPYESLGVDVIEGTDGTITTGGMSVANATAEIRFQVREKIGLVAFADYGEVWTEDGFGGDSGSQSGAGVGVRYDTPVGPLRFDVAGPVSGDTADGAQFYLGLGQAF